MKCQKSGCNEEIGGRSETVEITHTYELGIRIMAEKLIFHLCREHGMEAIKTIDKYVAEEE